jgi:LmbE family N-acetylglucosaminyl deacetylase
MASVNPGSFVIKSSLGSASVMRNTHEKRKKRAMATLWREGEAMDWCCWLFVIEKNKNKRKKFFFERNLLGVFLQQPERGKVPIFRFSSLGDIVYIMSSRRNSLFFLCFVAILSVGLVEAQALFTPRASGVAATPLNTTGWGRVLFISAHPDDIEASAGGLISQLTQTDVEVFYVILTNGDKGCANSFCLNWTSEEIAFTRSMEAMTAAAVLNVPSKNVVLLDYEDAMLTSYPEQDPRQLLVQQIRTFRPDVILTWYPYPNFNLQPHLGEWVLALLLVSISLHFNTLPSSITTVFITHLLISFSSGWDDLGYHPDHQRAGKLALDASFDSGVPLLWPASGPAWSASQFYFWTFNNGYRGFILASFTSPCSSSLLSYPLQIELLRTQWISVASQDRRLSRS